jgi:hypothetical protein
MIVQGNSGGMLGGPVSSYEMKTTAETEPVQEITKKSDSAILAECSGGPCRLIR